MNMKPEKFYNIISKYPKESTQKGVFKREYSEESTQKRVLNGSIQKRVFAREYPKESIHKICNSKYCYCPLNLLPILLKYEWF